MRTEGESRTFNRTEKGNQHYNSNTKRLRKMKCNKKILIRGNIRNESFMFSAMQKAAMFGLSGFVKPKSRGLVLIEAEGKEEQLNKLIDWCKKGTVWSDVDHVQVEKGQIKNHKDFIIKKSSLFQAFAL